ncbi:hypothetical protein V2J09_023691 [Rumex salicifolius]
MEDVPRKQQTTHFFGSPLNMEDAMKTKSKLSIQSPILPPKIDERKEVEDDDEEEDGPRMGDLIRQAMPCKLAKAPSLPASKIRKEVALAGVGIPKGTTINKLTRRSSMDPSLILLAKNIAKTKGMKHGPSAPSTSIIKVESKRVPKPRYLERSMSLKSLSDKEVQGFQELGFTFDKEDLSSNVAPNLDGLQIKEEPSMVESYQPPATKRVGSAEDMKAQIKFWARAVASNMNQE